MIENLKDLEKLFKLCRKQGVTELNLASDVSFKLGELPKDEAHANAVDDETRDPLENFPEGELSPEELTFFANGGFPEDNPYRNQQ